MPQNRHFQSSCMYVVLLSVSARGVPNLGKVRLAGASVQYRGRVEFQATHDGGDWGTVCDRGWHMDAAHAVCQQLGFEKAIEAVKGSRYGYGNGKFLISNMDCNIGAQHIDRCHYERVPQSCDILKHTAAVVCDPQHKTHEHPVRFWRSTEKYGAGLIEIYVRHQSSWGTLCHSPEMGVKEAHVICRQMGYTNGAEILTSIPANLKKFQVKVTCKGGERSLNDCRVRFLDGDCKRKRIVVVQCNRQRGVPGCYKDDSDRDLSYKAYSSSKNTHGKCREACWKAGYLYAGVQHSVQCFCGHSYGKYGKARDSECKDPCYGNRNQVCGGDWRNWVMATMKECSDDKRGGLYFGSVHVTRHGAVCQRWDKQTPHTHITYPSYFRENYCRNWVGHYKGVAGKKMPWCLSTETGRRWDYCEVPLCIDCKLDDRGTAYKGAVSFTTDGIQCQPWKSQSPHSHPVYPDHFEENFCRNTDGVYGKPWPWCYTVDANVVYDYCDIPVCAELLSEQARPTAAHPTRSSVKTTTPSAATRDNCLFLGCLHDGTCDEDKGTCTCSRGYQGDFCEEDVDECILIPRPCHENATCHNLDGSYRCECNRPGYYGDGVTQCTVDACAAVPCMNGATCVRREADYECICAKGFSGRRCERKIPPRISTTRLPITVPPPPAPTPPAEEPPPSYEHVIVAAVVTSVTLVSCFVAGCCLINRIFPMNTKHTSEKPLEKKKRKSNDTISTQSDEADSDASSSVTSSEMSLVEKHEI